MMGSLFSLVVPSGRERRGQAASPVARRHSGQRAVQIDDVRSQRVRGSRSREASRQPCGTQPELRWAGCNSSGNFPVTPAVATRRRHQACATRDVVMSVEYTTTVKLYIDGSPSEWLPCAIVYLY